MLYNFSGCVVQSHAEYSNTATIFCTQYPKKDWHSRFGGGIHADSIMDRMVHNAAWIFTGAKNMRELTAKADLD